MTRSTALLALVAGALIGLAGAVTGYVAGGISGEVAGIFIAMPLAVVTGVWIGSKT